MPRSKDIKDYFDIPFSCLSADTEITFDVHLYFQRNDHIMLFKQGGDYLTLPFVERYNEKGLQQCWILKSQKDAYDLYILKPPKIPNVPGEGMLIAAVNEADTLTDAQKQAIISEVAVDVLQVAASAKNIEEQKTQNKKVNDTVREVIAAANNPAQDLMDELWKMADYDPQMEHAVNVANYSALFAMAFGKIDASLLSDLALAGLLHDIGISQTPVKLASMAMNSHTAQSIEEYSHHVDHSISLIEEFSPEVTDRVKNLLKQHHEKFNGTGYPGKLKGFDFDDLAQLVAMADMIDSLTSGHWDGTERTLKDAFTLMSQMESSKNFPEYFNPEVFGLVMKWIKGSDSDHSIETATQIVESQMNSLVGSR